MKSKNSKDISSSYDTILKESATLITFSGILFGFFLNISINPPITFSYIDKILLLITLYTITTALLLYLFCQLFIIIYNILMVILKNLEKGAIDSFFMV